MITNKKPKIIDFDKDPLFANKPEKPKKVKKAKKPKKVKEAKKEKPVIKKEKPIKKPKVKKQPKVNDVVEFQDLTRLNNLDEFNLWKIDYCVDKPIEEPKPVVKPVVKKQEPVKQKPIVKKEEPKDETIPIVYDYVEPVQEEETIPVVYDYEEPKEETIPVIYDYVEPVKEEPKPEEPVEQIPIIYDYVEPVEEQPIEEEKPEPKKVEEEKLVVVQQPVVNQPITDTNNVLLEVIDLRKQYTRKAKPAIDKLNFKVLRGQFHAFIGANGAGKTTTIKSIVGAYARFEGQVKICGLDNKEKMSKAKLGYIPEIARFPSRISAFDYLKSMAMLNRLSAKEAEEFTKNILIEFKMYDLKHVSPNKFSSGQKKKILLAQALSNDPDILIMDEPAANLDPKARIDFFNILKALQKRGKSIFISSHILSELDLYADSLTILDGGKIAYTGVRTNEFHKGNKYAYRINLLNENDFGNYNTSKFTFEQDVEESKHYIVSCNDKLAMDDFLGYLFKNNKVSKIELYKLSIEDMYKKYVVLGSVHTGYKLNVNSTLDKTILKKLKLKKH